MDKSRDLLKSNLKRLRGRRGLTQDALSGLLDMSLRGYQKYENGSAWPNGETFDRLSEVLKCTPYELIGAPASAPSVPSGLSEAISLLNAFESQPAGLKAALLTLIYNDEEYLTVFQDPATLRRASRMLDEVRAVFGPSVS